ncbi:AAA family ATPase [Bradyrhizobium symbiodeficiens]|uniref:AAA family ATPase n=1 Tax=Bradyrhizobium symbiodeficiens TaxID=1404367 RepID=UPI0030CCF3D0
MLDRAPPHRRPLRDVMHVAGPSLATISPASWIGPAPPVRWLAESRIPPSDITILAGNGGSGKTELAVQLLIAVAAGLGDWIGCSVEDGPALFLSCEEPEHNIRARVERICKHHCVDPRTIKRLHLFFPDLDGTALATADRAGKIAPSSLFHRLGEWIARHHPRLVVIDSVAAIFDGDAIARRQVRAFLAMLRRLALANDVAFVLLDHPSVRGMADGTGTANSVDWRNSVRSMLHVSDPLRSDRDMRTLVTTKANYGRTGEKVTLRWNGLTFVVSTTSDTAPRADVDEIFLRLLDKRIAQGRHVHAKNAKGSAPSEFELDPEAAGVKAEGFRNAMERLLSAGKIVVVEAGPASRRRQYLARAAE